MFEVRINKPGDLYGGISLYVALLSFPRFRGLSTFGIGDEVLLYLDDGTTVPERQAIIAAALAHVPFAVVIDRGPISGLTAEQAEQWIDDHVGGATTAAEIKASVITALKAIARKILA
jgi:hypothetical protein